MREIDFGVISEGFNLIWRNFGPFVLASFCAMLIPGALQQVASYAILPVLGPPPTGTTDLSVLFTYLGRQNLMLFPVSLIGSALAAPFWYAVVAMTLKASRGQPLDANDAFCGFRVFLKVAGLFLLVQLLTIFGLVGCFVGTYVVAGLLMFSMPVMADRDSTISESIRTSIDLLREHWLMAALFMFVVGLCAVLGIFACCIGMIVSLPLLYVCPTLVYRDFTMGRGVVPAPAPTGGQQ